MPEAVAVMERSAMEVGDRDSSVRANIMAVLETVAMASDIRNLHNNQVNNSPLGLTITWNIVDYQ